MPSASRSSCRCRSGAYSSKEMIYVSCESTTIHDYDKEPLSLTVVESLSFPSEKGS